MKSRNLLLLLRGRRGLGGVGRNSVFLVPYIFIPLAFAQPSQRVLNGGFEQGLKGWHAIGSVHLETNRPLEGRISALIGPGPGSLTQRIETGNGNDFTVYATIQSASTDGWTFAVRFLDKNAHEVMSVNSLNDVKRSKQDPRKFEHFMKAHPLTKWVELVVARKSSGESVLVDQVGLEMEDENAVNLKPTCDLAQEMQPFWLGKKVYAEAVLMMSEDGKPASGRLMFQPSRIISVRDYSLATNYQEGLDYKVEGRTLICAPSSRMTMVKEEELAKGELNWNALGGKQVMVDYEHDDVWQHPCPSYLGNKLPNTMKKLQAHTPLKVVAYGDSITHGIGESRLSHFRPYLPPWPELVVNRLKVLYQDEQIQLYNSAQSGADSRWATKYAARMVASLNPDLVLIAFGQNDFWNLTADSFSNNIAQVIKTVRDQKPGAEFLLISTVRFDPAYSAKPEYWNRVGEYADKLNAMTGPGVQFVDVTGTSEWVYAAKKPKDCLNDPLHPNDYFARWYAQCVVAALDAVSGRTSTLSRADNHNAQN